MIQCENVGSCPPSLLGRQPPKWSLETLAQLAYSREEASQWSQNRDESVKVITHLMDII